MNPSIIEVLPLIKFFKEPILKGAKGFVDEVSHAIDNRLYEYLLSISEKYSSINTFYHRKERVQFYDVYFSISVRNSSEPEIKLTSVSNLFAYSNCCSLIGNAGSGKSMLFKHLFFSSLNEKVGIPVVIELRNLNKEESDFIAVEGLDEIPPADALLLGTEVVSLLCDEKKVLQAEYINELFVDIFSSYQAGEDIKINNIMPYVIGQELSTKLSLHENISSILSEESKPTELQAHGIS